MAYFIFTKNLDNIENSIYRIAENTEDLNYCNINDQDYKIIEDTQANFNNVKLRNKWPLKYNGNTITYVDIVVDFGSKKDLTLYIDQTKNFIFGFLDNSANKNHPLFPRWNSYYQQLINFNPNTVTFPLNKSLEQYFVDIGQTSLNTLQLP
jgi:hypothetical protein